MQTGSASDRNTSKNLFYPIYVKDEKIVDVGKVPPEDFHPKEKINKVKAIGDGEGVFTQGMGMLVNKPKQGFGMRSWRYSMLVDNGEVVKVFEEPGKNNSSDDDDPFTVSDVDTMIEYLKTFNERNTEKKY